MYHRKDGRVVKERDDLMSATRYGLMMRRESDCAAGGTRSPMRRNGSLWTQNRILNR